MMTKINQDAMIFRLIQERRAWKEIHFENLRHNVQLLSGMLPKGCEFMAVVKADAYGHGAVPVSSYLNQIGVHAFAVATLKEGIELRRCGVKGEILILGYTSPQEASFLTAYDLIQTAVDCTHALALNQAALAPVRIHLKLDTGMHRLGEDPEHLEAISDLFSCAKLRICGMYSHLCVADSPDPGDICFTRQQIKAFFDAVEKLKARGLDPGKLHLQSSYGVLNYPGLPLSYARFGIAMYGVFSQPEPVLSRQFSLRPVLSLHTKLTLVKDLRPGESVSYGRNFVADHPMRIAAAAIGYADGLPRSLSNQDAPVLIHKKKARILGNICMDQLLIDVTDIPEAKPGDLATLIGAQGAHTLHAEELARMAGTITNELLCRLNLREG